jgi:lysophospholipase L1-like esterase
MRRLIPFTFAAILTLSGCAASASSSPKGHQQITPAPDALDARIGADAGGHEATPPATAPVVMMLGDSYTAGIPTTPPEATYAAETARRLNWQIVIAGYRGTGFVTPGRVGKTFMMLYDEELAWRPAPDMVIVAGGHNDWPHDPRLVATAAQRLLTKIQQRWPGTTLVLTGPMWGGDPSRAALRTRNALKGVANEMQIPFIDPLQERWITGGIHRKSGNARRYIRGDGVHPNAAGNRYFADRLIADLRRLGLDQPKLSARK